MSLFNDFIYFYHIDKSKNSYKFLLIKDIMYICQILFYILIHKYYFNILNNALFIISKLTWYVISLFFI